MSYPSHLAISDGRLYVADTMNARIQVLTCRQAVLQFGERGLYLGNLVHPKGVAVDGEGNIYVVESYHDHLLVYDKTGRFLMAIGGTGKANGISTCRQASGQIAITACMSPTCLMAAS